MANPTIHLKFRYLESEYVRAVRAHQVSRLNLPLDVAVVLVLGCSSIFLWSYPELHWMAVCGGAIAVGFLSFLAVAFIVFPRIAFRRQPKLQDEYSLTFSEEGIEFQTNHIDSRLQWNIYSRAMITSHFYLLYNGPSQFTVIPKRAFQSADEWQAFEKLLTQRVPIVVKRTK